MAEQQQSIELSKADEKNAKLTLSLKADSGYSSTETHRVSANQWSEILMVCADAEMRAKMAAAPALFEALQGLVTSLATNDEDGLTEFAEPMCRARAALASTQAAK